MKTLIAAAVAAAFALPAFAQTSTPSAQEKLPTAEEREEPRDGEQQRLQRRAHHEGEERARQ